MSDTVIRVENLSKLYRLGEVGMLAFWIVTACAALATFLGLVLYRLAMPHLIVRMGG